MVAVDLSAIEVNLDVGIQHLHQRRAARQSRGRRNRDAAGLAARSGQRKRAGLVGVFDGKAVGGEILGDNAEMPVDVVGGDFNAVDKRANVGGKHRPDRVAGAQCRGGKRQHRKQEQAEYAAFDTGPHLS